MTAAVWWDSSSTRPGRRSASTLRNAQTIEDTSHVWDHRHRRTRSTRERGQGAAQAHAGRPASSRTGRREEFGARSFGNRSILADPRNTEVVQEINEAIKARDFWMPFCPSVLAERSPDYLVNPKGVRAPYMILSFDTTERWTLIEEFQRLTGVGAVLNTSFNLHGFPIVSRPEDALDVLDRSGLRHLAISNWLVSKV